MIAAIELAVLTHLRAMEGALGFAWRRLDTFPEDWEAYLEAKGGEIKGPAAWVVFTGWTDAERIHAAPVDQLYVTGSFALLVGHSSARPDEQANRHGGPDPAIEPGSYRLALGAAAVLAGQMLGLDLIEPIEVGDAEPLPRSARMKNLKLSVHHMLLTCRFPIALAGENDPDALEALHVNWDVPAFGSPIAIDADPVAPGVQLPDDFDADATDHLLLETDE